MMNAWPWVRSVQLGEWSQNGRNMQALILLSRITFITTFFLSNWGVILYLIITLFYIYNSFLFMTSESKTSAYWYTSCCAKGAICYLEIEKIKKIMWHWCYFFTWIYTSLKMASSPMSRTKTMRRRRERYICTRVIILMDVHNWQKVYFHMHNCMWHVWNIDLPLRTETSPCEFFHPLCCYPQSASWCRWCCAGYYNKWKVSMNKELKSSMKVCHFPPSFLTVWSAITLFCRTTSDEGH